VSSNIQLFNNSDVDLNFTFIC